MVQVASFDGTNDYATANDSTTLRSPTTAITFAGWLYRVGNGQTWGNIVSKNLATGTDPYSSYTVFTNGGAFGSYVASVNPSGTALGDNQVPASGGATTVPTGAWKFVAVIWQASTNVARFRIWNADGSSFYDQSKTLPSGTTIGYDAGTLVFGGNSSNEAAAVRLACWGIHNAVLSDADLTTWRTTGVPPVTCSGGYWSFDGVWTDSAQSNTLTATNGATFVTESSPPWSGSSGTPFTGTGGQAASGSVRGYPGVQSSAGAFSASGGQARAGAVTAPAGVHIAETQLTGPGPALAAIRAQAGTFTAGSGITSGQARASLVAQSGVLSAGFTATGGQGFAGAITATPGTFFAAGVYAAAGGQAYLGLGAQPGTLSAGTTITGGQALGSITLTVGTFAAGTVIPYTGTGGQATTGTLLTYPGVLTAAGASIVTGGQATLRILTPTGALAAGQVWTGGTIYAGVARANGGAFAITTNAIRRNIQITGVTEPTTSWQTTGPLTGWAGTDPTSGWATTDTQPLWTTTDPAVLAAWTTTPPASATTTTEPALAFATTGPTI